VTAPIILIGGAGFLGSALRTVLAARGHEVLVVGRGAAPALGDRETYVPADDLNQLPGLLAATPSDSIIDLAYATVPSTSVGDPVGDFSDNLGALLRHLELARSLRPRRYIFVSSGGTVYGDAPSPVAETLAGRPLSPYGITKLACEHYALLYYRVHDVPAIVLRPSNVYGPGQRPRAEQGIIAAAFGAAIDRRPLPLFDGGAQIRDFLYVDDFCAAVMAVLDRGSIGDIYNVGSGAGISIRDLLDRIGTITGEDGLSVRLDPRPRRRFDVSASVLDIARLASATGWAPATGLDIGLRQTWDWLKSR
jgi:UDP-glucose 4-epimerase